MRTLIELPAISWLIDWLIDWLICALTDSGSERRDSLLTVTSHQTDVIERISGQRSAKHTDVTLQLGNRRGHLQVSNKSASAIPSSIRQRSLHVLLRQRRCRYWWSSFHQQVVENASKGNTDIDCLKWHNSRNHRFNNSTKIYYNVRKIKTRI